VKDPGDHYRLLLKQEVDADNVKSDHQPRAEILEPRIIDEIGKADEPIFLDQICSPLDCLSIARGYARVIQRDR
jgi:hypothetical protein